MPISRALGIALPVIQQTAGWLLILAGVVVFAAGFVFRAVIRKRRDDELVDRMLVSARRSSLARTIFGEPAEEMTEEEFDLIALMPAIVVALCLLFGGLALVAMDSFGIELNLFRLPS